MDIQLLLTRIEQVIEPVLEEMGLELAERELIPGQGRWILRLYIDCAEKPITLDDCTDISRKVEALLDVEGLLSFPYVLEVSSPGEARPLRKRSDFARFAGATVDIQVQTPMEGRRHFTGELRGMEGEEIIVVEGAQVWHIPYGQLKKARLKRRTSS